MVKCFYCNGEINDGERKQYLFHNPTLSDKVPPDAKVAHAEPGPCLEVMGGEIVALQDRLAKLEAAEEQP